MCIRDSPIIATNYTTCHHGKDDQIEYWQGVPKGREMRRTSPYMHKEEVRCISRAFGTCLVDCRSQFHKVSILTFWSSPSTMTGAVTWCHVVYSGDHHVEYFTMSWMDEIGVLLGHKSTQMVVVASIFSKCCLAFVLTLSCSSMLFRSYHHHDLKCRQMRRILSYYTVGENSTHLSSFSKWQNSAELRWSVNAL